MDQSDACLAHLAPLLFKYTVCSPAPAVAAHFEKHIQRDEDLTRIDLRAAGVTLLRMDVFLEALRKTLARTPLHLSNAVCSEHGVLELFLPPRPQRNPASKRHREVWADEDWLEDRRKDKVCTLELQQFDEKSPLARVQRFLCTELGEIRFGDRPLDMQVEASSRGVLVLNIKELRMSDVDYMLRHAQVISARFAPDNMTRHASVEVHFPPPNKPFRVAVNLVIESSGGGGDA